MRADLFERWILPLRATDSVDELVLESPDAYLRNFGADNYQGLLEGLVSEALAATEPRSFRIRFAAAATTAWTHSETQRRS